MIYLQLFLTFLKVGAFAFGGGYAMLSLIGDSVLKYGWMTEEELLNFVGVETVIPGPIAVNMATYIDLLDTVINVFTTFIAAVSAISLLVGGIGVMNIMLVTVTERTREIGIRKALGAKTSTILFQFLTESVILCLLGGLIGLILGSVGAFAVASYMNIPIEMKFSTIVIAVGFSTAIGVFFGIYPARRAAKMQPIDALRSM